MEVESSTNDVLSEDSNKCSDQLNCAGESLRALGDCNGDLFLEEEEEEEAETVVAVASLSEAEQLSSRDVDLSNGASTPAPEEQPASIDSSSVEKSNNLDDDVTVASQIEPDIDEGPVEESTPSGSKVDQVTCSSNLIPGPSKGKIRLNPLVYKSLNEKAVHTLSICGNEVITLDDDDQSEEGDDENSSGQAFISSNQSGDVNAQDDGIRDPFESDQTLTIQPEVPIELESEEGDEIEDSTEQATSATTSSINNVTVASDDSEETITGDKSIAPDSVLKNPNVEVCIVNSSSDNDVLTQPNQLASKKRTLRVLYPRETPLSSYDVVAEAITPAVHDCLHCSKMTLCKFTMETGGKTFYLCSSTCVSDQKAVLQKALMKSLEKTPPPSGEMINRKCTVCSKSVPSNGTIITWETMDYCSEECLGKYQRRCLGMCAQCSKEVPSGSLGKYCVRFGSKISQFCAAACLDQFKKGLKSCSYCQKDIGNTIDEFLAPVGEKGTFKDFCSRACLDNYVRMSQNIPHQLMIESCSVCTKLKIVQVKASLNGTLYKLCSDVCFAAFQFVNGFEACKCAMCKQYYDKKCGDPDILFFDDIPHGFCSAVCKNVYILSKRSILSCAWCKVKKYNFDMVVKKKSGIELMVCSLNCLALFSVSLNAVSTTLSKCDMCSKTDQALFHLTMSDATVRNFCSYQCVQSFQRQYHTSQSSEKVTAKPAGDAKKILTKKVVRVVGGKEGDPVLQGVSSPAASLQPITSAAPPQSQPSPSSSSKTITLKPIEKSGGSGSGAASSSQFRKFLFVIPPGAKEMKNKCCQVRPVILTKGVSCQPNKMEQLTQTEAKDRLIVENVEESRNGVEESGRVRRRYIPIPIPIYVPIPLPIIKVPSPYAVPFPIPVPIPVFIPSGNDASHKKEQFEGEMAEGAAINSVEQEASDQSSLFIHSKTGDASLSNESEDGLDKDGLYDFFTPVPHSDSPSTDEPSSEEIPLGVRRKRPLSDTFNGIERELDQAKRAKPISNHEKSSAKLKTVLGVKAWHGWVQEKNTQLVREGREPLNSDILVMTNQELNYSLSLFVKEVRKPNGDLYHPDSIFYLCLALQDYRSRNGAPNNIFTDHLFENFTDSFDVVAHNFLGSHPDAQSLVARVEEEHLWEAGQLGPQSPYILLTTLLFFNTKYFHLRSPEDHIGLTFGNVVKQWKKNPCDGVRGKTGVLRYFPSKPDGLHTAPLEQEEDPSNRYRCPVKLYEFYLSKCPESFKGQLDSPSPFYLEPERCCIPDSPVWYSATPLRPDHLSKMLNRLKMVREIHLALNSSLS